MNNHSTDIEKDAKSLIQESVFDKKYTDFEDQFHNLAKDISTILELDELDATVYLRLLKTGPNTASAVAKELDIDRAKMYRTVDKMAKIGIVSMTLSSPKLCIPLPPEEVSKIIIQKKEDSINTIKKNWKGTIQKIEKYTTSNFRSNIPTFRVINGRENIFLNIEHMIENCSDIVYIITTLEDISKMYHSNIPDKISICEKNGSQVRLLVDLNDPKLSSFVMRFGATETRISNSSLKGRIVLEKGKQMIMSDTKSNEGEQINAKSDFSLYTDSPAMVNNVQNLCEHLWAESKPIKAMGVNDFKKDQQSTSFVMDPEYKQIFNLKEAKQENIILNSLLKELEDIVSDKF